MPRIALSDRPIALKIYLPETIYARLRLEVWDGLRGNASYGKTSGLITRLLQEHFKKKEKQGGIPTEQMDRRSLDSDLPQEAPSHGPSSGSESPSPGK